MSGESFPEPLQWNGPEWVEPDILGMADEYEGKKEEALVKHLNTLGREDLITCILDLWTAMYSDVSDPTDKLWHVLTSWDIEWTQLKIGG